jgi:hypothetical protein
MNKKTTFFLFLVLVIFISGCKQNKNVPVPSVTSESVILPKEYNKLRLDISGDVKEKKLALHITLTNENGEAVPLDKGVNENLLTVTVATYNNQTIGVQNLSEEKREKIQPKEIITWDMEQTLQENYGEILVSAKLNLQNGPLNHYEPSMLESKISVDRLRKAIPFMPNQPTTYIYHSSADDGEGMIENFIYFNKDRAQSNNSISGTNVYSLEEDGLYLIFQNTKPSNKNLFSELKTGNKELLLSLPARVGKKWDNLDKTQHFEIISTAETVTTSMETFKNVIVVMMESDLGKTLFFYHESYGLVKLQNIQDNMVRYELELSKVQKNKAR